MKNVLFQSYKHKRFRWKHLGNIREGRGGLGEELPVLVYRLMQFTLMDTLSKELGLGKANEYFRQAGLLAGTEFAKNVLNTELPFDEFVNHLQDSLESLKIGVLRVEDYNAETGEIVFTVCEDLDCSGLPSTGENVCLYDEGFIAGILQVYTSKEYNVREVDCWANGSRLCRFIGKPA